jgi:hypothetical protein
VKLIVVEELSFLNFDEVSLKYLAVDGHKINKSNVGFVLQI